MGETRDPLGLSGTVLEGKYALEGAVGEGGAAVVYRARNVVWNVPVAVKFLVSLARAPAEEQAALLDEFMQEGRLVADLSTRSAAIVQPRDLGILRRPGEPPLPYLVLEWLDGRSLDEVLVDETRKRIAPRGIDATMKLLEPVAVALAMAHRRGIAHRDIKPENMILVGDPRGPDAQLKILDFGIAKVMSSRLQGVHQTGTMPTAFTPHYGAPEQFTRSFGDTGPWTDVFAMALVLLEVMRGGRRAFDGDDYAELGRQSCDELRRPTPKVIGLAVSDAVDAVFARALAVPPAHRYENMHDFWTALVGAARPDAAPWRPPGASLPPPVDRSSSGPTAVGDPPANAQVGAVSKRTGKGRTIVIGAAALGLAGIVVVAAREGLRASSAPLGVASASSSAGGVGSARGAATAGSTATAAAPVSASAAASEPSLCPDGSVIVAGGRFGMGVDAEGAPDEGPEHLVYVDTFCLHRNEVTAAEYAACASEGRCPAPPADADLARDRGRCNAPGATSDRARHPMNCVSWDEASAYCRARGMRLPTEAEWELAATSRGTDLPWGNEPPEGRANLASKPSAGETRPGPVTVEVGSLPGGASKDGVNDLVGNVAEWVGDWYGPYGEAQELNPRGPDRGDARVVRGGAWSGVRALGPATAAVPVRRAATVREKLAPDKRSPAVGFRCAQSIN